MSKSKTKFSVKVNKEGNYDCNLSGNLKDLAIMIASLMQENVVIHQLITGTLEVYEVLEAEGLGVDELEED